MSLEKTFPKLYTPYTKGHYSIRPGFNKLELDVNSNDYDQRIFQLDNQFYKYMKNKNDCRNENIKKYYQEKNLKKETSDCINKFMIDQLISTYPEYFYLIKDKNTFILEAKLTNEKIIFDLDYNLKSSNKYLSLFDALCSQVQEDICICKLNDINDNLVAIHLCHPSYWSAEDKIGMSFSDTHQNVAGMEKMLIKYRPLLDSIFKKGPFFRFAWDINTDDFLNHHPDKLYLAKKFDKNNPVLFVRLERQTIIGFKDINSLLFTIRTYYTDINKLSSEQLIGLRDSLLSMTNASLDYKRIKDRIDDIIDWLNFLIAKY